MSPQSRYPQDKICGRWYFTSFSHIMLISPLEQEHERDPLAITRGERVRGGG